MSVEVQWNENDPETGEKRFIRVERFASMWQFYVKPSRRGGWEDSHRVPHELVTREMWETLLDSLERRMNRREGVTEAEVRAVRKILEQYKDPPTFDGETIG